jgi:hypothetical protein
VRQEDEPFSFLFVAFILGNLLKNVSCFVGRLTLLKENDELERVSGHRLVQIRELELMCLELRSEDFFTLLLRCGHFHHSTEVATLKIPQELYLMPHELMHRHESGLLGGRSQGISWLPTLGNPATASR